MEKARAAIRKAFQEFDRLEGIMTVWREDSDVSRINRAAGKKPVKVDMHPNPLAPTEVELKRVRLVRSITVKVVSRGGKPGLPVGFAEVVLEGKRK